MANELSAWLDELYPPACRLCAAPAVDGLACAAHRLPGGSECEGGAETRRGSRPSWVARCARCAARLPPPLPDGAPCADCRRTPPPFASTRVLGSYRDGALADWILALKYGGRRDLAQPLVASLLAAARGMPRSRARVRPLFGSPRRWTSSTTPAPAPRSQWKHRVPWVVPIPAHPLRRFERGYDQAEDLAREVARQLGWHFRAALARVRFTAPQGAAGTSSRLANVRSAFLVESASRATIRDREIWLVDDVMTSGATLAEAARMARRAGARVVHVLCLARGGPRDDEPF